MISFKTNFLIWLVILTILDLTRSQQTVDEKTVTVQHGDVKGKYDMAENNRGFYSFKAIPYAKPPIKELRFKLPEEPERYQGVIFNSLSVSCPQNAMFPGGSMSEEEDCLTLDIYTRSLPEPNNQRQQPMPVVVYLPGGGQFRYGNARDVGGKYLLEKDIVLVVVSYRVGVLGFLSTQDSALPGNLGLHDQQMALKWVTNNIGKFNGDSSKITLMGMDSGAAAVSMHITNQKSRSYFKQAFMSGGSLTSPWAFHHRDARRHTEHFAYRMGCVGSSHAIVECLRYKKIGDILKEQDAIKNITFLPVVDKNFTDTHFFDDYPILKLKENKVAGLPIMLGMANNSGLNEFARHLTELAVERSPIAALSMYFKELLVPQSVFDPNLHAFERHQVEAVAKGVQFAYFRDAAVLDWSNSPNYWIEAISDFLYRSPAHGLATAMRSSNQTYVYQTEFNSAYSFKKYIQDAGRISRNNGPVHMDDIFYFFDYQGFTKLPNNEDRYDTLLRSAMREALERFLLTGNPGQLGNRPWNTYGSNYTVMRITGGGNNQPEYVTDTAFRSFQLNFFSDFVLELIPPHGSQNVYYDHRETHVSYGALTWVLLVIVLIFIGVGIIGYVTYRKQNKNRKGFETVSMHAPAEKVDLRV